MAMFDYCQFILLNHSCEDYQKDNCDNCNESICEINRKKNEHKDGDGHEYID